MPVVSYQEPLTTTFRSWAICHSHMVTTGPRKMCQTVPAPMGSDRFRRSIRYVVRGRRCDGAISLFNTGDA